MYTERLNNEIVFTLDLFDTHTTTLIHAECDKTATLFI